MRGGGWARPSRRVFHRPCAQAFLISTAMLTTAGVTFGASAQRSGRPALIEDRRAGCGRKRHADRRSHDCGGAGRVQSTFQAKTELEHVFILLLWPALEPYAQT